MMSASVNTSLNDSYESLGKINKALELSGKEKVHNPRIVLIGHSAGGSVIKAASVSGDLCKIAPSDVVWSDSTYGYWFDSAWKNCLSSGKSNVIVLIRKWTKTWDNFRRFIRNKKPYDFLKIKIYTGKVYHRTIGDNAIQFSEIFPEGC